jgi:PAS domain S-box-containing protein
MMEGCELMEAALESFPEGLALLDREGEVAYWNRAAANITGFPIIDMRSRSVPWALALVAPGQPRRSR